MTFILIAIGFIAGIITCIFCEVAVAPKKMGTLVLDETDPEKDVWRFELDADPETIAKSREVLLTVKHIR